MREIVYMIEIYKPAKLFGIIPYRSEGSYYWIEYRVDENRFWYNHGKSMGGKRGLLTSHHTKQDKKNSVSILEGIRKRAEAYGYKCQTIMDRRGQKFPPDEEPPMKLFLLDEKDPSL